MRISPQTAQLVLVALQNADNAQQKALIQLTTGRRVNLASDDPAAAALEVNISAQMDSCDQFLRSAANVSSELQTADSSLSSVVTALQRAITLGVEGANGTLSQQDRTTIAQEVRGILQQVMNAGNLSYNGTYVFGGTANAQPPYVLDNAAPGGVKYQGNEEANSVEVQAGEATIVNQPGSKLFSAAGANIFKALDDLASALESGSSTTGDIGNAVNEVTAGSGQLNSARAFYGTTIDQLRASEVFLGSEKLQLSSQQNDTVGIDMNTAATNLSNAEAARNATIQAASSMNNLSLMDYISGGTH